MEPFEKAFLWVAALVLVIFLCALGYSSVAMGIHLPSHFGMIHYTPDQKLRKVLRKTPPFDHPGVREIAPGKYEAVIIGKAWSFHPRRDRRPGRGRGYLRRDVDGRESRFLHPRDAS